MDLGLYRHRRVRFWCGIVIPLAVLCMAYAAAFGRQRCLSATRSDFHRMSALAPRLQAALDRATARLSDFAPGAQESGTAAEALRRELADAARTAGVTVSSLVVEEQTAADDSLALRQVSLQGSGTIQALTRWSNALQRPGRPVLIDSLILSIARIGADPTYELQATLRIGGQGAEKQGKGGEAGHVEN